MKPFIFQFKECPSSTSLDLSSMLYDPERNLNIDSSTGSPAVLSEMMATETGTKTYGEQSDSDRDFKLSMATTTGTFTKTEDSDSDKNAGLGKFILATVTGTRTYGEESDSDQ